MMFTKQESKTIEKALDILSSKLSVHGETITCTDAAAKFCRLKIAHLEHEVFAVMYLNKRHQMIGFEEIFRGTIDGASVYPREVAKAVLQKNAAAVIFAHNHPSGVAEPSQADINITQRLINALDLLDVRVLDHIIVGAEATTSLAARGLM